MHITLSPVGEPYGHPFEPALQLERQGDSLIINGQTYDLSVIPVGATLPDAGAATGCPYITGAIERDADNVLHLTLLFPHAAQAPREARFPEPIINPENGVVSLPDAMWPKPEREAVDE